MQSLKPTPEKYSRLEARITPDQKALFQHAADLLGRSVTDFAVSVLQEAAKRIIQEHEVIHLSLRDQKIFIDAVMHPAKPNKSLRAALKNYKKVIAK